MTAPLARMGVERRPDGQVVVTVVGEVDLTNSGEFEGRIAEAVELAGSSSSGGSPSAGPPGVVVDLSAVDYLDSYGLRALLRLVEHHREGVLRLLVEIRRDSAVGELLAITGVAAVVPVVEPEAPLGGGGVGPG